MVGESQDKTDCLNHSLGIKAYQDVLRASDGVLQSRAKVVLVATHADEVECTRDGEGYLYNFGAARLLQDFRRRFKQVSFNTAYRTDL